VFWAEALDAEIRRTGAGARQSAVAQAPFAGEPAEYAKTEFRFASFSWTGRASRCSPSRIRDSRDARVLVDAPCGAAPTLGAQAAGSVHRSRNADDAQAKAPSWQAGDAIYLAERRVRRATGRSSIA